MPSSSSPTPPDANAGGSPAGCTSTACTQCWTDDYDKEISVNSCPAYYTKTRPDGSNDPDSSTQKYKIYVPVASGNQVTVEVRFKAVPDADVSADDATAAKGKLTSGVTTYWNGKFNLTASDSKCGNLHFPIVYKAVWVDSGEHYTVNIHSTYPREGVTGLVMDVSKTTTNWTYAHEFGHCHGMPDEYSYRNETQTVKYVKPDGTFDAAVSAPFDGKSSTDASATLMAAVDNTTLLPRHAFNIAIEAQTLLTEKLGRKITCSIS